MMTRLGKTSLIGIVLVLLACATLGCRAAEDNAERDILKIPPHERERMILQQPPDRQIDLYLLVVLRKHPPDLALADAVAQSGADIVPALTSRLKSEKRDVAKMHLIDVFLRMEQLSYYPVASDAQVMALLEEQVATMQDQRWRKLSSEMVERIKAPK